MKKQSDNKKKNNNQQILVLTYMFVAIFISVIGYILFFVAFQSENVINNAYNHRADLLAKKVVRGNIYSRNMDILASTIVDDYGNETRIYPFNNVYAHAIGYCNEGYSGVEAIANFKLLKSNDTYVNRINNDLNGKKNYGDSVITTFDNNIQMAAYEAFGTNKGAVIAINVKTGEILALVSKPDFNPNELAVLWSTINEDMNNSVLLNRATQGLYPPGSTFKILTALEYIKEFNGYDNYSFDCNGSFAVGDDIINCYHGQKHGSLDLKSSFAKSCNSSFANISTELNKRAFSDTCNDFLFNSKLPIPFSYKKSYMNINDMSSTADVMQAGIGQGKTQITPIHMAMITSAIANDGVLMKPYVVSSVINKNGRIVKKYSSNEYGRVISSEQSEILKELMSEVVINGTASRLNGTNGYDAAGKTGSAEYSSDKTKSHAWFTGFAPVDNPEIAVAVIAEGAGSGGEVAVPIARMVFDAYFNN